MRFRTSFVLIVLAVFSAADQRAGAQSPRSVGRPTVNPHLRPTTSPYLNLLRDNGQNTALNYYRLVRPEMEFRRANVEQLRSIERLGRRVEEQAEQLEQLQSPTSRLGPTGHATSFLNYGGYFGRATGAASAGFGRRVR